MAFFMRILFVCLGNICRSPMAHGLMRHKVAGLDNIHNDSAGTSSWHESEPPDPRAIKTLKDFGIDISDLRSRPVIEDDFKRFDIIYAMDESNLENLLKMKSKYQIEGGAQIKLILSELDSHELTSVPDPYFGGDQGFYLVHDLLDRTTDNILQSILK